MIRLPEIWFSIIDGATERPATWVPYRCFARILPVFMFTSISAMQQACELAKPPIAIPRPVRMTPVCLTEFATRGCHFASVAADVSTSRHWLKPSFTFCCVMFWSRNWYGSMFAT